MMRQKYKGHEVTFVEYDHKRDIYVLFDSEERLVAELKRHEYLSQPQLRTIGNSNGRYRKSSSQVRGNPAGQSGGAGSPGTIFYTVAVVSGAGNTIRTVAISAGAGGVVLVPGHFDPIEDAGFQAGEIIGRRCWWLMKDQSDDPGWLHSVYMHQIRWSPNEPVDGNVSAGLGVHAYKSDDQVDAYQLDIMTHGLFSSPSIANLALTNTPMVTGTVAMWGEIVEHERGYRAEHAKILSLDTSDQSLRMKYGV
jgi:hypothetical protein